MNGRIRAKAASTDIGMSGGGNPKIVLVLTVTEDGPDNGKQMYTHLALTRDAAPYTIEKLRNLGWKGDDITDFEKLNDASYALPDEASIVCHEEMYEGKPSTVVDFINKIGAGVATAKDRMNDAEKARLKAEMKSIMAASGTRAKDTTKPPAGKSEFDDL